MPALSPKKPPSICPLEKFPKQANIPTSLVIDNAVSKNLSAVASYQSGDMREEDYLDKDILERRKRELENKE